ncbi:hypothetical protein ACWGJ9_10390 [Curtobacterium citreum]
MQHSTTTNGRRSATATAVCRALRQRLSGWVERNIIADDPTPAYSRLDRADGLGR